MNKLLVHLHIYYHEQVDYFISKLKNINGIEWDLVVTYSQINNLSNKKILDFKRDTQFIEVENFGYDIWPFINVIKNINLKDYKYIIKLHTKRSVRRCAANVIPMKGFKWRDTLVEGILFSPQYFSKIINRLESQPSLGMISNLMTYSKRNWDTYYPWVERELKRLGLHCNDNHFCMGTMFIARSEVFVPLKSELITKELFQDTKNDQKRDFTSAHYYERLLSVLPSSLGLKHLPMTPRYRDWLVIKTVRILEKPVRWIFGIEKKGKDKRKFVRIFGMEFFIEKPSKTENP